MAQKRINFKLSKELSDAFDMYAKSKGVTKSNQIREWITGDYRSLIITPHLERGENNVSFHFFLNTEEHRQLVKRSELYGLGVSTYLRLLLRSKMLPTTPTVSSKTDEVKQIESLWTRGKYNDIIDLLSENPHYLSESHKIILAKSYMRLFKYRESEKILDMIENYVAVSSDNSMFIDILLCRAYIAFAQRNFKTAASLLNIVKRLSEKLTSSQIGNYYLILGVVNAYSGRTREAGKMFLKCIDYIDDKKDVFELATAYSYLAFISLRKCKIDEASDYMEMCRKIVKDSENKVALGIFFSAAGRVETLSENYKKGIKLFNKSEKINEDIGNYKILFETYGYLAITYYLLGNYDKSNSYVDKALKVEEIVRPEKPDRLAMTIKLANGSSCGIKNNNEKIRKMIENPQEGDHEAPMKLVYFTSLFLNGDTKEKRDIGKSGLRELSRNGEYIQIRSVAKTTLKNKAPQPFTV